MVKQQCHICKKWFDRLVTHWRMSSACQVAFQLRKMETAAENISQNKESVQDFPYSKTALAFDNSLSYCEHHARSVMESRVQELILEGIEEHCTSLNSEDHGFEDFISNRNMALDEHNDNFTIDTEESFFPLPYIEIMGTEAIIDS